MQLHNLALRCSRRRSNLLDSRSSSRSNLLDSRSSSRSNLLDSRSSSRSNLLDSRGSRRSNLLDSRGSSRSNLLYSLFNNTRERITKFRHVIYLTMKKNYSRSIKIVLIKLNFFMISK
jgi:hypothetical protein